MFSSKQLFELAMKIEEMGCSFYKKAANLMNEESTAELLRSLADEELSHKKIFEGLKNEPCTQENLESKLSSSFTKDIDTLESTIFDLKKLEGQHEALKDPEHLIEFVMSQELATIHYFSDIKFHVSPKARKSLEKIIDEERKHLSELIAIKSKFTAFRELKEDYSAATGSKPKKNE